MDLGVDRRHVLSFPLAHLLGLPLVERDAKRSCPDVQGRDNIVKVAQT